MQFLVLQVMLKMLVILTETSEGKEEMLKEHVSNKITIIGFSDK